MNPLALLPFLAVAAYAAPQHVLAYVPMAVARQIPEVPGPPADLPGGVSPPGQGNGTAPGPPSDLPTPPAGPPADLPGGISPPGQGNGTAPGPPSDLPMIPGQGGGSGDSNNGTGNDQGSGGGGLPIPGSPIVASEQAAQVVQLVNLPQTYIQARSLPVQQPYVSRERVYVPVRPQYVHTPAHYAFVV